MGAETHGAPVEPESPAGVERAWSDSTALGPRSCIIGSFKEKEGTSHGQDQFRRGVGGRGHSGRVPAEEGEGRPQERGDRRHRLRRPGPGPVPQHARQRLQGHHRPGAAQFKREWDKAIKDGWVPGKTLFPIEEAAKKATIIQYLVSDAAQKAVWPTLEKCLKPGDALYFSHGFSIVYKEQTGVIPPKDVDVILVAPKGSGASVRANFLAKSGINSSYAVFQDATGRAKERTLAVGIAIGSGYLFPTTFQQRGLQRPHRRARRADGRLGRDHGSPVRRAAPARPLAERGLQRDGRGADAEPDPAGGPERHGLDVLELQHHGPAGRPRLEAALQEGGAAASSTSSTSP